MFSLPGSFRIIIIIWKIVSVKSFLLNSDIKPIILKTDEEKNISRLQITIHEGKNREVRKMCEAIGKKVLALHRRKIGNLDVKNIELGKWRYLNKKEVEFKYLGKLH